MNMVRLAVYDRDEKLIESNVMTPQEAADKAREFVFLQGADPDHGGVGATKGFVRFEPVKLDNPVQPSRFLEPYKQNFETLKRACKNGDLALMQCRWKKTDSPVAVICAVSRHDDGGGTFMPMGMMFVANPFELVVPDVGEVVKEPVSNEMKLVAELHELEGRAHAIRQLLKNATPYRKQIAILPVTTIVHVEGGVVQDVEVTDATGVEVEHLMHVNDLDETEDDVKLTVCQKCGAGDVTAVQVEKEGFLYKCDACGHSFVGLMDGSEDAAEMRRLQGLDPLSDVIEDKHLPDGPDEDS